MKNLLSRGGIEIVAVFLGISGGLWSEKQIELKNTLKSEVIALETIRDQFASDSLILTSIKNSINKEQKTIENLLKHIQTDTILTNKVLNSSIRDLLYFSYFASDNSEYESLIKVIEYNILKY